MDFSTLDNATLTEWTVCGNPEVEKAAKNEMARRARRFILDYTKVRTDATTYDEQLRRVA